MADGLVHCVEKRWVIPNNISLLRRVIIIIIIIILVSFSHQCQLMVLPLSLRASKSTHVSRTLLSIPVDLNSAIIWMVLIHPLISNSSSLSSKHFATVASASTYNWYQCVAERTSYFCLVPNLI